MVPTALSFGFGRDKEIKEIRLLSGLAIEAIMCCDY